MKPWLETWVVSESDSDCAPYYEGTGVLIDADNGCVFLPSFSVFPNREQAIFVAAAPEMCRALLAVEWGGTGNYGSCAACPDCGGEGHRHESDCDLDTAITKAGLPDQESRDAARKELGI